LAAQNVCGMAVSLKAAIFADFHSLPKLTK